MNSFIDELERELRAASRRRIRIATARVPRPAGGVIAMTVVIGLVLVIGAFTLQLRPRGTQGQRTPASRGGDNISAVGGIRLVYDVLPSPQSPANAVVVPLAEQAMRLRLKTAGIRGFVFESSAARVTVDLPGAEPRSRAFVERLLGTTAGVAVYDWEATVLDPNGKTVASQLQAKDPAAYEISQGSGTGPGGPGSGTSSLYQAVALAARQPAVQVSPENSRLGPEFFMFGQANSTACAALAKDNSQRASGSVHCLLAGPAPTTQSLSGQLPAGVDPGQPGTETFKIPQGTTILQAIPPNPADPPPLADNAAQYYVLKDRVLLFGNNITNPQPTTNHNSPSVQFAFSPRGQTIFQQLTAEIAHRGQRLSGLGQNIEQHYAIALGGQLLAVPPINFKTYPDGINSRTDTLTPTPATPQSARTLVATLRLGAHPPSLKLIQARTIQPRR